MEDKMSKNANQEEQEYEMTKEEKRQARRNRRIRNQILAYVVFVVFLAGLGVGGYFGVDYLITNFSGAYKSVPVSVSQDQVSADDVQQEEPGIITSPDYEETVSEDVVMEEEDTSALISPEIQAILDEMTLEQKVANLFVVSPEAITGVTAATRAGDGTKAALEQYAVGGFIYADKNITGTEQFCEMVETTKTMYSELYGQSLWTFVQEEGAVNTVAGKMPGITAEQSAGAIGETGDATNAYVAYTNIGNYLFNIGIDVNLGPVCDVKTAEDSYLGERSFGAEAGMVSNMVRQCVDAGLENAIIPCLTAFPGRGDSATSPEDGTITTERTLDDMRTSEFLPFQAGIDEGATMIMVSHLIAANATGEEIPCSLSSVMIEDVLRGELGFEGVVITDRMDQAAITSNYSSGEASVLAIQAGADMILCPENFEESYQAVLDAVSNGTITEERIDESLNRILSAK